MNSETVIAIIGGLSGLIGVVITSLRKREDDTVSELRRKLERAEIRIAEAESERDEEATRADMAHARAEGYKEQLLGKNRTIYALRTQLSVHNIADPTVDASGDTLH